MKTVRVSALVLALAVLGASTASWAAAPGGAPAAVGVSAGEVAVKGKVDAVTVYRGQALVTRVVEMPAGQGLGEYVVSDLPERIIASSIFAEGEGGVEVRSVRYRERPVAQDVREEVRKIDDQLQTLSDKIALNQKQMQVFGEQRALPRQAGRFHRPHRHRRDDQGRPECRPAQDPHQLSIRDPPDHRHSGNQTPTGNARPPGTVQPAPA